MNFLRQLKLKNNEINEITTSQFSRVETDTPTAPAIMILSRPL